MRQLLAQVRRDHRELQRIERDVELVDDLEVHGYHRVW